MSTVINDAHAKAKHHGMRKVFQWKTYIGEWVDIYIDKFGEYWAVFPSRTTRGEMLAPVIPFKGGRYTVRQL